MITIKASFAECIERLIYHNSPIISYTKEIAFDNNSSKKDIIKAIKECRSFSIEDDYIYCTINRTVSEILQQVDHAKSMVSSQIGSLRKWCDLSEENKQQIFTYLKYKNLDWVIEQI